MSRVSVIVSVYSENRLEDLLACIDSLKKQSRKPDEIILVLDPKPVLMKFFTHSVDEDVKIVVSDKYGLSNARNVGIKNAEGEIVAFIDDDAVAEKCWLEKLVKNYEDPNVMGVGGSVKPFLEKRSARWFPKELNWVLGCSYKGLPEHKASVRNPIGCNMSFRRYVFEKAGYFRPDVGRCGAKLLAGEEPELSMRVLEKISDGKIMYDPSAVVYHKVDGSRLSIRYVWKRSFYEGVSKAFILKFPKKSLSSLSTEKQYLQYLLKTSIPLRLRSIYKFNSICQLIVLMISIHAVFMGFMFGKL